MKPGGLWLTEMKWGENAKFDRIEFTEVTPPEKLVWLHSPSDADWNIADNPMMPDWPRILLTTVTFEEKGEKTNVRLSQVPVDATEAEVACFAKMMANMDGGWGQGYAILDEMFAELQAK